MSQWCLNASGEFDAANEDPFQQDIGGVMGWYDKIIKESYSDVWMLVGNLMLSVRIYVDPAFRLMRFPLEWRARFLLEKWFYLIMKTDLESPLIFVLFLKGK